LNHIARYFRSTRFHCWWLPRTDTFRNRFNSVGFCTRKNGCRYHTGL